MRYILADELHCFPPDRVEAELARVGTGYVQLLERIAEVLAQKPRLFFQEIARSLPSYWALYVQDLYPDAIKQQLLESLRDPQAEGFALWETLAPYVLKKGTTLAVETIVYERQDWVLALLQSWTRVEAQLPVEPLSRPVRMRPLLGMVLEGERRLNKIQILAIAAAQTEANGAGDNVPFGEMATRMGMLTPEEVTDALAIQRDISVALDSPKRLGFYLLEAGVIAPTQLRKALSEQRETGLPLGQLLVKHGAIDEGLLSTLLAVQRIERIASHREATV